MIIRIYSTRVAVFMLLLALLLAACTSAAPVDQEPPTPTPLPPDPALERPTYTVERGEIARLLEVTARATPIDLVRLSFRRDGRVNVVNVGRGDTVAAGDVIAELQQDEVLDELLRAEDELAQARRDLENARVTQQRDIESAELDLEQAREDLTLLLPGGENDVVRAAQKQLEEAEREARRTRDDRSWEKTNAEEALRQRADALVDAQEAFSTADWNWKWVERYGTDPDNPTIIDEDGNRVPNRLTDKQKKEFQDALEDAATALRAAERGIEEGRRSLDLARENEVLSIAEADEKVEAARRELDRLINGSGSRELRNAQLAVERAETTLRELRAKTLNAELKRIEDAERALERAQRRVDEGRIIAPQDGEVIAIAIEEGVVATAFEQVVEIADPTQLEFAATLGAEQMRQLAEGQPAEARLLARPDIVIPTLIRRMPAPYGSGGSGSVQDRDQTTRFEIVDAMGQELTPGASVARIMIVLERKEDALWLPPDAIRSFEGRRFVVVREGDRERRVPVRIGIVTEERAEILEGLEEGDLVVGQ
jgi:multidrug efflux pump subunit AcrA (membrane-fusion protein)